MIQNPPAIPSPASTNAVIGKFRNSGKYDIFQIVDSSGADVLHMNYDGSLEPPIYPLIYKTVLSTAELLTLSTVPVEIIPAANSGTIIVPQYVSFQLDVVGPAFSIANGGAGNTYVYWGARGIGPGGNYSIVFVPDSYGAVGMDYISSESQFLFQASSSYGSAPLSALVNQPVMITMDDALSDGAGNSMLVTISYVIVTV